MQQDTIRIIIVALIKINVAKESAHAIGES
jgi:hypothetical protein